MGSHIRNNPGGGKGIARTFRIVVAYRGLGMKTKLENEIKYFSLLTNSPRWTPWYCRMPMR